LKKFISSLLVCSTLFSCVAPNLYCSAEDKVINKKILKVHISPKKAASIKLNINEDEFLKNKLLELSKNKNFTDQVIKNYTNAHEAPIWLKIVKILCLPFNACWFLVKKTCDYVIGKKATKFIENTLIPTAFAATTGLAIYNKIPSVHKFIDYIISFIKTSSNETE